MLETTTKTVAYHQATSLVLLKHPTPHVIACGEHAYYTLAEFALVLQVSIAGMSNRHTTIWRGLAAQPSAMGCVPCSGDAPRTEALRTITLRAVGADGLAWQVEQYVRYAVTTSPAAQQVQRRDLGLFLRYMAAEEGTDQRLAWPPRLARVFQQHLRQTLTPTGAPGQE